MKRFLAWVSAECLLDPIFIFLLVATVFVWMSMLPLPDLWN